MAFEVISCGANVPFADDDIFLDLLWNISTTKYTLPFNCGMVRVLLYL
jgi:hypothetical protein